MIILCRIVQGGKVFFLEHVYAKEGRLRLAQRLFRWLWSPLTDGCNICRETQLHIRSAGFQDVEIEEFQATELTHPTSMIPGVVLMSPHISGTATKQQ